VKPITFFRLLKWGLSLSAGLLLLLIFILLTYRAYLERTTRIKTPNGISSLEEITLGNVRQWIFIRGTDQKNPVLLFLHGGPGAPLLGMPSSRIFDAELIKHFTVVHWDQRGAGKSFNRNIPADSMTIDRFVEDCNELINYLRERLHTEKVFLVAHSGGTIIGIKTAYKYPEKIHAYVGVAQIIDEHEGQKMAYDFLVDEAEKSGDVGKLNTVKSIGPPPYESPKKFLELEKNIGNYGGFMHNKRAQRKMLIAVISFLTSPEYSLTDGIRTFRNEGFDFTINAMWEELKNVSLTNEIHSIQVPVYFFEGRYDMATPSAIVERFFNNLEAEKGKTLFIFENSGHMPMIEEKEKYEELIIDHVLKETGGHE
jgi:proline-specific peptidase